MATTFTFRGVPLVMTLGPAVPAEGGGAYRNGTVTAPSGRRFGVGGGWIHSAASALHENHCHGLATDTHPDIYWPGAMSEGSFEPYYGYDTGNLDGLAAELGVNIDLDTDEDNWRELVEAVQSASADAHGDAA